MASYLALLRCINVSGQKKVPMAELRDVLTRAGLDDVQTYIQSGNVVCAMAEGLSNRELANRIQQAIQSYFEFEVPVLVLKPDEWERVRLENPFLEEPDIDIKHLHVTLLDGDPDASRLAPVQAQSFGEDRWQIQGRRIYLHCPNGYGRTKLTNTFWEKKLALPATTRNWKTVLKLAEMIDLI